MENKAAKILAIDDNQDNLTVLKALVTEAFPDMVVLSALNGRKALEIADKEEPDVILLDIFMPGMDGFEVCRKLKADKLLRDIPVVFITASKSDKESRIRALEAGAEAFLSKPFDESELIAQIRAMFKIRASNIQKRNENNRLEKTSQENVYRFQSMFDHMSSSAAIYKVLNEGSTGKDYIVMDFNKAALQIEGNKKRKDVLGKSLHDLRPNIDKYGLIPALQKAWQTGKPVFPPAKEYIDEKHNSWHEYRIFKLPSGEIVAIYDDVTDKLLIQEKLEVSEQRFRVAQEISPDGFTILHPVRNETGEIIDFVFVYENQAIARINQTDPQKIISKRLLDIFPDHRGTSVFKVYIDVANTGKPQILEEVNVGELLSRPTWLRLVIVSMSEDIVILAQDITERKMIEQDRQKFFMLAESSSEFIGMCDLDMNPLYVNPTGRRMVGLPDMAAACRVKVQDYYFPEDQRFIAEEFFPRVLREGHGDVEIRLRHFQTGETIWMFYYLFRMNDTSGKPVGWATVSRDITEKRKTDEALIESERRYRHLFENSGVGIVYYTVDGIGISFNKKALENMGGNLEDYMGKSYKELLPKERAEKYFERIEKAISCVQPQEYEDYLVINSCPKWFSSVLSRVSNSNGEIIGVQIASLDITDRKKAEEKLSEIQNDLIVNNVKITRLLEQTIQSLERSVSFVMFIPLVIKNGFKSFLVL